MDDEKDVNVITEAGLSGFEIAEKMSLGVGSIVSVDGGVPISEQFYWHEVIGIDEDAIYLVRHSAIFDVKG